MLLLLLACKPDPIKDSANADDSGDSDAHLSFDCGDVPVGPSAGSDWINTAPIPASGFTSISHQRGTTFPVYAGTVAVSSFTSQDQGQSWMRMRTERTHTQADLVVDPIDPSTVWRSDGGVLRVSTDAGASFGDALFGGDDGTGQFLSAWALGIAPWDGNTLFVVDNFGLTHLTRDGGSTWEERFDLPAFLDGMSENPYNQNPWRLQPGPSESDPIVFSDGMTLSTSDDLMNTWQARFTAPHASRAVIRHPDDGDRILVGATDGVYRSDDGGASWEVMSGIAGAVGGAWSDDGSWLALVSETEVAVSEDGGSSWTVHSHSLLPDPGVGIVGERLLVGADGGIWSSDDRGVTFTLMQSGLDDFGMSVVVTHPECPNRVWAASRCGGGLYASTDYGANWTHDRTYSHYAMNLFFAPSDPNIVWSVSDDRVLKSTDGGLTWQESVQNYHYHALGIDPANSDHVLLGSVGSGLWNDSAMHVYRTVDGGETWEDSSTGLPETSEASAHQLYFMPDDPSVVLLATYLGGDVSHNSGQGEGVWRSTDGGLSWNSTPLNPRDVAWLTEHPSGVVAATEDGLWLTEDAGGTWRALGDIPDAVLGVDFYGDLGIAISYGGSLWRSDDAGETWEEYVTSQTQDTTLAMVAIDATGTYAYATLYDLGIYRIQL